MKRTLSHPMKKVILRLGRGETLADVSVQTMEALAKRDMIKFSFRTGAWKLSTGGEVVAALLQEMGYEPGISDPLKPL